MKNLLIKFIRFYQKFISINRPPTCKYYPTCSAYSIEAIEKHGSLKGVFMSGWRILRCNPFSKGGYDPVPDNKHNKIKKVKNG
jgi:hypothetical protein